MHGRLITDAAKLSSNLRVTKLQSRARTKQTVSVCIAGSRCHSSLRVQNYKKSFIVRDYCSIFAPTFILC